MKLDVQPRYAGNTVEFYKIIASNIRYPAEARGNGTEGGVYVMFEVDTTGQIPAFDVLHDIGDGCGSEAVRTLSLIPNNWTIAKIGTKKYRSRFIIPIVFKIVPRDGQSKRNQINAEPSLPQAEILNPMIVSAHGNIRR